MFGCEYCLPILRKYRLSRLHCPYTVTPLSWGEWWEQVLHSGSIQGHVQVTAPTLDSIHPEHPAVWSRVEGRLHRGGGCWSFTALNFTPHFFQWFHILDVINCKVYLASLHSSAICLLLICSINWCIALNSRIFILTAVWSWVTQEELMWENRRRPLKQSSCVHMRRTEEYQEHPSRASSLLIQIHWSSLKWKCYKSNNKTQAL